MSVVLYHAHVSQVSGGYVGVDIFFVISGFLITGLLWRELEARGAKALADFYGRRMRRLLPAAMTVLILTMFVSVIVLPPLELDSVWKDGLACALYVGNYRFALAQTNYLTASAPPSPFQHYWSLAVEEQFYLVWPVLLLGAARLAAIRGSARSRAVAVLAVVTVVSFTASVILTTKDQPWAFFSLPTRAWELGLGGLIALLAPVLSRLPVALATAAGWAGLGGAVAAVLVFTPSTSFPGWAAVLPVAGTGLVLASGLRPLPSGPVLVLGRGVPRFLGRISYSLYLWHWPVLILAPFILGQTLSTPADLALVGLSIVLATLTYALVEQPARTWGWAAASPRRSLSLGTTLTATGIAACLIGSGLIPSTTGHGLAPVATIRPALPQRTPAHGTDPASPGSGATTANPGLVAFDRAEAQVRAAVASSARTATVPANLTPPLSQAVYSQPPPDVDGCLLSYLETVSPTCLFGDTTAPTSIVLFGDSHAAMWFPAVDAYANEHDERLYVWTKATCPADAEPMFSPALDATFTQCTQWIDSTVARIEALRPALVVFGIAPNYGTAYQVDQYNRSWLAGLTTTVTQVEQSGARVVVIGPVPSPPEVVPDCLSANLTTATSCDIPNAKVPAGPGLVGTDASGVAAEKATVTADHAGYIDVDPWFCTATTCPVIVDNILVYRDNSHITVPWADYLAPLVDYELALTPPPASTAH